MVIWNMVAFFLFFKWDTFKLLVFKFLGNIFYAEIL